MLVSNPLTAISLPSSDLNIQQSFLPVCRCSRLLFEHDAQSIILLVSILSEMILGIGLLRALSVS